MSAGSIGDDDFDGGGPWLLGPIGASVGITAAAPAEALTSIEASATVEASADAAIAEALACAALDPVAAQELLVDQIVAEHAGALAPAELAELRGQLAELLAGDPAIATLLRP